MIFAIWNKKRIKYHTIYVSTGAVTGLWLAGGIQSCFTYVVEVLGTLIARKSVQDSYPENLRQEETWLWVRSSPTDLNKDSGRRESHVPMTAFIKLTC
ncbi:hypothetical protein E2C01_039150 [Portunus trituberculatus]|uniref:Uncharacterized protein n=1 Tax=Portunus trituberculatus TaxID=210409 RepID=A0A5B7FE11_PORTR|nr:hypothetical protein [Portunus trituberculatus]